MNNVMREIKFRAWDGRKGVNKWYSSYNEPFTWSLQGDWMGGKNPCYTDTMFPDGVILMQYTGLKDKNGKEIYEGDIVKSNDGERDFFDEIKISPYFGTMFGKNPRYELGLPHGFEVIGNIYQNPELLINK